MNKIIGFIGTGNMGQAMIGGIISSNIVGKEDIIISDTNPTKLKETYGKFGVKTANSNILVANLADILILSVKPNIYESVITEIRDYIKKDTIVITIAAGITLKRSKFLFQKNVRILRAMPNTPALVGEGMTAITPNEYFKEGELEEILEIFKSFGKVEVIKEELMDVVVSTSGSSPAYVFMMIEAMADSAVSGGMSREMAYKFAAQAVMGAAKMVLDTNFHPGFLKDMVCSPNGTTIEAVEKLEECGFRNAIMKAMKVCENKSKRMS